MKPLKLAVIGAGHLGRFHARLAASIPEIELVGVVDPDAEARDRVTGEFGGQPAADWTELSEHFDAAVLAAPTALHHALGMQLLDRGKHLLIEKPLARNTAECRDLVELAEQQGLVLQVGHIERFNPALRQLVPHIRDPRYIEANRFGPFTFRSTDIGVVLDLMIHDIDLVLSLVRSPVAQVEALGVAVLGKHEDVANARLTFESGCVATLNASRISFQSQRKMQIWSRDGFANIDFADHRGCIMRPSPALARGEFDAAELSAAEQAQYKESLFRDLLPIDWFEAPQGNAMEDELDDFVDSIFTPRSPRVSGRAALEAVAVAERILAAVDRHAAGDGNILRGPHWHGEVPHREAG